MSIAKILEPTNRNTVEMRYKRSRPELVCIYDTGTRENHIPCAFVQSGNLVTYPKVGIYHIVPGSSQQVDINLQNIKQKIHSTKRSGEKHIKVVDNSQALAKMGQTC